MTMHKGHAVIFTIVLAALMLAVLLVGMFAHHYSGPVRIVLVLATAAYIAGAALVVGLEQTSDSATALKLMRAFALPSAAVAGLAVALVLLLQ